MGRRVRHQRYGVGEVIDERHRGWELLVRFTSGTSVRTLWLRHDVLQELERRPARSPSPIRRVPPSKSAADDSNLKARRMIEAFRLGIVPHDCVEAFTFGRETETRELQKWLRQPASPVHLIVGEYGAGKTHLLHYLYWTAIREQFVAAFVELDPNEAPLSKPKRVFNKLVQSLRFRGSNGKVRGFREFMNESLDANVLSEHNYFRWLKKGPDDESMWEWIEGWERAPRPYDLWGEYKPLPGLYDNTVSANIYCNLLSALGHAATRLGFGGLLLLFDEGESVRQYYYRYEWERSVNFVRGLVQTAHEKDGTERHPGATGLRYSAHSPVPFLYQRPSGLKLVFAFAGHEYRSSFPEWSDASLIRLQPLAKAAVRAAAKGIVGLYRQAYGFEGERVLTGSHAIDLASDGSTRLHVKALVEALDLARFGS